MAQGSSSPRRAEPEMLRWHTILYYIMLYCAILHLYSAVLYYTILHSNILVELVAARGF